MLNNVIKVEKIVASNLLAERIPLNKVREESSNVWTEIKIFAPASVEDATKVANKVDIHEVKMVLRLQPCEDLNPGVYAFRLTTADGKRYMLGMNERPYPVITCQDVHPDKVANAQGKTVTVAYNGLFGLVEIV